MINNDFISAVIVAAGSSTRMKSDISKQLIPLLGVPVLVRTVSAFEKSEIIDEIVVVCPEKDMKNFKAAINKYDFEKPIRFISGGSTRQQSVFNGVSATEERCDFIAIHDGARPLVKCENIESVVLDALKFGASTLAVPVKDTIKVVSEDNTVVATPQRDTLRVIQTPQVFKKSLYETAYQKAVEAGRDFTDDCQLIEIVGGSVHITLGDYSNIKITTPEDLASAESFLRAQKQI